MKKILLLGAVLLASFSAASKEIPLEDFAQKSKFASTRISPDGKHLAFTYEEGSEKRLAIMNLEQKKVISSFDAGGFNREVEFYFWPTNDRVIMRTRKITGWLDGQNPEPSIVSANIDGTKRYELWDYQGGNISFVADLKNDNKHVLVGRTAWRDGFVKLQRMNIFTGKMQYITDSPTRVGGKDARIISITADLNEQPRVAVEYDPMDEDEPFDDVTRLQIKKDDDWRSLDLPKNRDTAPRVSPLGFNVDNTKFYFLSNFDLKKDGVTGLFELDLKTNEITKLFRHPDVDIVGGVYGPEGELIGVGYDAGYRNYYYLKDKSVENEVNFHKSLRASFKGQNISVSSYTEDGKKATIRVYSDRNPGEFFLFDRENNQAKYLASSMPHVKPQEMSAVEPFIMTARDGLKMYGLMTIPNGKELKNLPMILFPHGGPYGAKDSWRWDDRAQMLANNGYLVVQLDFRGSGGYGYEFEQAGHGEYGGKMIDDLIDTVKWAIAEGYADKDRVCIHGVSYGGYASMQAAVKAPELFKCTMPDAGFYDLKLQWETSDGTSKNSSFREKWYEQMAGEENTEANLTDYSSATHLDDLKSNVLIIHGTEDVRVSVKNAYDLEKRLKEKGKSYEKIYKDDGHGFQKVKYKVELFEKMLEFLEKNIGK